MYWLDNNTGIPTAPTIPPVISAAKRYFTNGGAGVPPSVPEDFWFNMITDELLGVLDMAGIAPDKDDLGQLAKAIQSIAFSAYPVGAPIPWPTTVPPPGFIAMTGQSFDPDLYPKLALVYPSFVLPDPRAKVIRSLDFGKGIDVGRTVLSHQSGSVGAHSHSTFTQSYGNNIGTTPNDSNTIKSPGVVGTPGSTVNVQTTVNPMGDNVMMNIAFLIITRAA